MLTRLKRVIKHRWQGERVLSKVLPPDALAQLTQSVRASERLHSGEIRIYVEAELPFSYLWRTAPLEQIIRSRAVSVFGKLRVWDTAHNNGVLIYLLIAEQAIEIVADRGLNDKVSPQTWHALVQTMRGAFRRGDFAAGLSSVFQEVHGLLLAQFPLSPGETNPNELQDEPILR
ncbi:TPM domain-containing protein [Rhodoferax sp.]|uniref:TPM domain-containing protein n=1 Tax=Rhodoferax sp. TaxID=50421 RepID=UPI002851CD6A|nr:TPM domain-containing protein [Rhodoferax sp.]MDR3367926.1 TPM domain-containing protein [Rhodoferax sp.]